MKWILHLHESADYLDQISSNRVKIIKKFINFDVPRNKKTNDLANVYYACTHTIY